jgi:bifunctional DNA-binding transcriptional regulator/antitoxin component of YhaV-PrlF toxin-antitoxin module
MGANSSIPVQITEDGKIPVPKELQEQLRLAPFQTVYLTREGDRLLVITMSRQEIGERIVQILKEGLSGVAWEEIERERDDDAHRW